MSEQGGEENQKFELKDHQNYQLQNIIERLTKVELRMEAMQREITTNSVMLSQGMTGGASREFAELKASVHDIRVELSSYKEKVSKWEGGGVAIWAVVVFAGGFIGYMLNHLGVGK